MKDQQAPMVEIETDRLREFHLDFIPKGTMGIYLVGGAVRDILLGRVPRDVDIVVLGDLFHTAKTIAKQINGRLVDLGKKGFPLIRVASPTLTVDISPVAGGTIEADLLNRDFTLNALCLDLGTGGLLDPANGLSDIRHSTIRMVSPAALVNDPARLVRAFRFAAELGFSISPETCGAIHYHRRSVQTVSGERIWAELIRIFSAFSSAPVVRKMAQTGLLTAIFPELEPAVGCIQNRYHQFDVFDHTLAAYGHVEALVENFAAHFPALSRIAEKTDLISCGPLLKYSALLHDVGKPATRTTDSDGRIRFTEHDKKSAEIAGLINQRLKLSAHQHKTTKSIVRYHIRPLFLFVANKNNALTSTGKIRFFNACGNLSLMILVHAMADRLAKERQPDAEKIPFIRFCHDLALDYEAYLNRQETVPPLISGNDLITTFGLFPSPLFKTILGQVDEARLAGTLTTRSQALSWVQQYLERLSA
ncbi:HDIG domain-containing protein [Desulfosarcina sp. OttesenSCG-928-A07]|nr:HDIG domain-containing protein [Desulfosarcina sp. OttesenSCG-928-G17]MDL2329915.1 HDIG domain-containing protein [Desulfosarcina sp. OttesenSCG-928-A07]